MNGNTNFDLLAGVRAHIQALEASNAALRAQLNDVQIALNSAKEERRATLIPTWVEKLKKCDSMSLMMSVTSGIACLEILEGLDKTACVGFVVLPDVEESKDTLKIKFSSVAESAVFVERIVKVKYFKQMINVRPKDIFVLQGGWSINGVHDFTVWTYEAYQNRNNRPGPPVVINRRPTKKSKIDENQAI